MNLLVGPISRGGGLRQLKSDSLLLKPFVVLLTIVGLVKATQIEYDKTHPQLQCAVDDIQAALKKRGLTEYAIQFKLNNQLTSQANNIIKQVIRFASRVGASQA